MQGAVVKPNTIGWGQRCCIIIIILLGSLSPSLAGADNPGRGWERYETPEQAGWSSEKLEVIYRESNASALMVIERGKVVAALGDIHRKFKCHSIRKSFLSALYGIHVDLGDIDLNQTLRDLNIRDVVPLTESEKKAQVGDLLKARSGVYIPAGAETASMKAERPQRGSHERDTFWYYNNWDFNVLGTIFEKETGTDIFSDFYRRIAVPLEMEDFRALDGTHDYSERDVSIHPSYPFKMSARDMARFGQLYLQRGRWNGRQIIPEDWIEESTSSYSSIYRGKEGYGYLWYIIEDFNGTKMYYTAGAGGHYIAVLPAEDVVIVVRADTYTAKYLRIRDELIERIREAKVAEAAPSPRFVPLRAAINGLKLYELNRGQRQQYVREYKGQYINGASSEAHDHTFYIVERGSDLILERYEYFYHFKLLPLSLNKFFVEDLELFLVFDLDDKGHPVNPVFHKSEATELLYRKIVNEGVESALTHFEEVKEDLTDEFDLRFLAHHFESIGEAPEAIELLRWNVLKFPVSIECNRNFINKYSEQGDIRALTRIYGKTLGQLKQGTTEHQIVQWFFQWLRARAYPADLSDEEQSRYVGVYSPRHIIVEDGDLYYYRDDRANIRKYRLLKTSANVFVLDDPFGDGFRIQFVMGEGEKAVKIMGIYIDGRQDESPRSDSTS